MNIKRIMLIIFLTLSLVVSSHDARSTSDYDSIMWAWTNDVPTGTHFNAIETFQQLSLYPPTGVLWNTYSQASPLPVQSISMAFADWGTPGAIGGKSCFMRNKTVTNTNGQISHTHLHPTYVISTYGRLDEYLIVEHSYITNTSGSIPPYTINIGGTFFTSFGGFGHNNSGGPYGLQKQRYTDYERVVNGMHGTCNYY